MITSQPANTIGYVGCPASFSATATGTQPLNYQWVFNGASNLIGANNATLTLTNVQSNLAGTYAVFVTNAYGQTLSSSAVLIVNPVPPCDPPPTGMV